jgi:hypothetical protein
MPHNAAIRNRLPSHEALLLDYAQRLDRHRAGRRAVHIHLSELRSHYRREHHLRAAINMFDGLVRPYEGQIFTLANGDIIFASKGRSIAELDQVVLRLRYLFSEDPIAHADEHEQQDRFCTWYDIEQDYGAFLTLAQKIVQDEAKRASVQQAKPAPPSLKPLEPEQLGQIVHALAHADISGLIRRRSICAILDKAPPQTILKEVSVSILDLQRAVAPGFDILSNRWLFQYLTETLDRRMLVLLPKLHDASLSANISLNLNVSTLLSKEFLAFDAAIHSAMRGTTVIELQVHDVLADMGSYLFARDFVRERGYRICLDGVSYLAAPLIDREQLGLDLFKVIWAREMGDSGHEARMSAIKAVLDRAGPARAILSRADDAAAIEVGRSLGIALFEGRHVETLLAAAPKAVAAKRR